MLGEHNSPFRLNVYGKFRITEAHMVGEFTTTDAVIEL